MGYAKHKVDVSEVLKNLGTISSQVDTNTSNLGKAIAQGFNDNAQSQAPWTDHTGTARAGLYGKSEDTQTDTKGLRVKVTMGGVAHYQEYLEFDNHKRFAIVYPMFTAAKKTLTSKYSAAALNMSGANLYRDPEKKKLRDLKRRSSFTTGHNHRATAK